MQALEQIGAQIGLHEGKVDALGTKIKNLEKVILSYYNFKV